MDMDSGLFQSSFMQGPYCGEFPPAPPAKNNSSNFSGGLTRYHSAPSSVIQGLLDDDFYIDTDDSEMSKLLNDGIGSFASLLDTREAQQAEKRQMASLNQRKKKKTPYPAMDRKMNQQMPLYVNQPSQIYPEHPTQSPLSSISEHGAMEDPVDEYLSSSSTVTTTTPTGTNPNPNQNLSQANPQDNSSCNSGVFTMDTNPAQISPSSSRPPQPPPVSPSSCLPPVSPSSSLPPQPRHKKSGGLLRHSSSPAGFLNRLIMEEANERAMMKLNQQHYSPLTEVEEKPMVQGFMPQLAMAGQHQMPMSQQTQISMPQQTQMPMPQQPQMMMAENQQVSDNSRMTGTARFNEMMSTANRPGGLFRQSSSPAGLLSQIAMEELGSSSSSGSSGQNMGRWEAEFGGFGQRKRGRGVDDSILKAQPRSPTNVTTSPQNSLSPTNTMPGGFDDFEGSTMDSIFCKTRAKRGYATHPRSIAERVRRTKISERIKKLQDLVPNLDKQANTAEMLDEVVDYVKNLQRQVQELSLHRPMCTCAMR